MCHHLLTQEDPHPGPTGVCKSAEVSSLLPPLLSGINHGGNDLHKCPTYPSQEDKSKPKVAKPPHFPHWGWE